MSTIAELLQQGRREEVWHKYCSFLDLSLIEFMTIQERLLLEQLDLLGRCELGQVLLKGQTPTSVAEFRRMVPLTTYSDYLPYLVEKREDILPSKPQVWARTSGRSAEYSCKWAPYSKEMVRKVGEFAVASFLLASCSQRGDVRLDVNDVCLYTLAPAPYFTGGVVARGLAEQLDPTFIPSLEKGDQMEFDQRIREGFRLAMKTGIHLFYGLSSVLVAIAEQFSQGAGHFEFSADLLDPRLIGRVVRGFLRSKLDHRGLLPKDLWKVKGIVAGGMDTAFYRDAIEYYWGRKPLEGYGGTELGGVALQAWNYRGMTFLPDSNFIEFLAEQDSLSGVNDPQFPTRCLDEVTPGVYELVITNFHGGVFVRYRTGDLVEIVAMSDEELDIHLPQMVFHARSDGIIDIGGFTRITEKAMWQALKETGVDYRDWTMRKEYRNGKPALHLYLEMRDGAPGLDVQESLHLRLAEKDAGYADLEDLLGFNPLAVTMLPAGAFARYVKQRQAAGADLAHIKPPRVNPPDAVIEQLLARVD